MGLYSENGLSPADLAAITDKDNGGFLGGDGLYAIIVLFILMAMMGNGGFGGFGGFGGGSNGAFPWLLASGQNTNNDVQRGFDQSALINGINGIGNTVNSGFAGVNQALCSGFGGVNQALCGGFAGVNATINNGIAGVNAAINGGFAGVEASANARQIANMQQAFAAQTAIGGRLDNIAMNQQNCCCENRAAIADVKYAIATENCQDRYEAANNTRDIIEAINNKTQMISDKLCQLELDGVKAQLAQAERENTGLQNQLNMANMQASQTAQTAKLLADNAAQTAALEQYLNPAPIPAYPVQNPNCCGTWNSCGCGA